MCACPPAALRIPRGTPLLLRISGSKLHSTASDYMLLLDAETITTLPRRKKDEASRALHSPSGNTGCVRALRDKNTFKSLGSRELRPACHPVRVPSSGVEASDTRAPAANHAHTRAAASTTSLNQSCRFKAGPGLVIGYCGQMKSTWAGIRAKDDN